MSSDGGKRKRQDDEELIRADSTDGDMSKNKNDRIQKKRKFQNKIRCKRYRDKKKNEAINSKISKHPTVTVEEQEKIKRRQEKNKLNSQRYRDKKRTTNLINLQTNQNTVVKHVPNCQNFHKSQITGPSTKNVPYVPSNHTASLSMQNEPYIPESHSNYDDKIHNDTHSQANFFPQVHEPIIIINNTANSQNIKPHDIQNNTQDMHSQLDLPVQTYSSFQQNSSAHRVFQKDFFDNDFGHACEICDRLWFKKDLKIIVNNDATPNIKFIRTLLTNVNVTEVKVCSTCLTTIKKNCVPPLSVFNGFKYPPFPENLKNFPLDLVTERLISPRIPFMQIRRLQHIHGQCGIYGQVINVPVEVNTMVRSLPRNVDDDHSITVHIKRRKIHKSSYVYSIVNNGKIKAWLRYLIVTPLYTSYGITVDDSFLNDQDGVQHEFVYDEDGDNDISEQILIDENLIAQQQTLLWNDEMYLRIAPGEDNVPISLLFDEHAEELSFPQIYLGQFRTFRDGFTVTPYMMATSELRRSDRRGVTPQHLLYLAMKIMRIRIRDSLSIAFKHIRKGTTITKEQIESENHVQDCFESNLAFLRMIPNSTYYCSTREKDLFAMIRQYGKPTVFFTISANEMGWPKLLQLLYKLKNNSEISVADAAALHFIEKSTLVNEDAVTCAIYFNKLINVLLKILQSKRFSPFKKYRILYYFKRIEFQHRGSTHAHILAWLDNAPEDALKKDYNQAINLIDFLISVSATEASGNIKLQTHKHTFTCYEGLASKRIQKCRFEAPFMPIKTTMILTPMRDTEDGFKEYKARYNAVRRNLENYDYDDFQTFYQDNNINSDEEYFNIIRAGINRPRVFPKRQPHEKWYNPFNSFILNIVKSNTDFQFITEEYSCAAYIVEYVNKTNRGVSNLQRKIIEIMDEHPEFDIFHITKDISIKLLNHTEMTSQEAAWYLLREPMSKSSTIITYIPTVWPVERQRIKKTMRELSESDEDCTDIWKENWFDKYQKRPEDLENISLAQFVSQYFKNNKGEYVKRDEPRVIHYRNYDMATDINEYKREMVTLHIPFRHEEAEILEEMKFIRLYDDNVDLIFQKRKEFESNMDIERTLQICRELCREENPNDNEEIRDVGRFPDHNPFQELYNDPNAEINDDLQLAMLNKLGAVAKKKENIMSYDDFYDLMHGANEEQREILFHTMHPLISTNKSMREPLLVNLTGAADSGKAFVIRGLMEIYNRFSDVDGVFKAYIACASTGKAATTIDGSTVHSALSISLSRLMPLNIEKVYQYRTLFEFIKVIIVDGVSVVSAELLENIDIRLKQITGLFTKDFGGLDIILIGDLRQLPSIRATPIFKQIKKRMTDETPWRKFKKFELHHVMRQEDSQFVKNLTKIGNGNILTEEELQVCDENMHGIVKSECNSEDTVTFQGLDAGFSCVQEDSVSGISLLLKKEEDIIMKSKDETGEIVIKQELEMGPTVLQPKTVACPLLPTTQHLPNKRHK